MAQAIATEQTQPTDDEPSPASGPPRVFSLRFNGTGMAFAALFFGFSLFPHCCRGPATCRESPRASRS